MITNLLFDLGGVIFDIKKDNCVEAFKTLGLADADSFFGTYGQQGPFLRLEEGTITPQEFHEYVRSLLPKPVTDAEIDSAFMKFLLEIPSHRLHQLLELRQRYGTYLLSNTNIIMWQGRILEEFRKDGLDINAYFDGIVTSFEAKLLKPKPEIFLYAERTLGIKPDETLFLDDSQANIEAAAALGFNTALVPEGKEFMDILRELKLA